jgi:nucleoside-diphosphate-sugar epimerase
LKTVLVAGGAGYVGCRLVDALLARQYRVIVSDKLMFGKETLTPVLDSITLVPGDIRDAAPELLDGVDAVINVSGLSNDPTANYNPAANKAMNTDAAIALARLCVERGVRRYVLASSCSVYYTEIPVDTVFSEEDDVDPQSHYSSSKFEAEKGVLALASARFSPVVLRKGTLFGWSPRMRYDLVVNTLTKDAFRDRRLIVHAGGKMWRPMLHVDDAVDAYIASIEADDASVGGQVFNVLGDNYRVIDIAKMVRGHLERAQGVTLDLLIQNVGTARSYRVDGSKARRVLGIDPRRTIPESLDAIWQHLESGIDPNDSRFYNIVWLELLCDMERRLTDMGGHVF